MSGAPADTCERERLRDEIARCWPLAREYWSRFLLLSDPVEDPKQESIAQIDLLSRQVSLNPSQILYRGLTDCVEALLAHEIGHHVRYPGTFQTQARLRILERSLIPFEDYSIINVFTDLMINERLGASLKDQMIRIYQAFTGEPAFHAKGRWKRDPLFLFYLAVYEALWQVEPGGIMGPSAADFGESFPGYRAEAAVLAQDLFLLGPNLYTQFLYFLSVATRYLRPIGKARPRTIDPYQCGRGEPSPDDWAQAMTPIERELEAIRRAQQEGWFDEDQGQRLESTQTLDGRIAGIPGAGSADATKVPETMAAYYRQQAEIHLLRPPAQRRMGEAHTPTTLEEWEPGDSTRDIDWLATLSLRGHELGSAAPLIRTRIAEEEGFEVPMWQPRMEIYLDVSGSMPNPCATLNAMTLAAQILALGTVRAGGWVRALLYSDAPVLHWEWCRSEVEVSRFLMHYLGGGTAFPFATLDDSVRECGADAPIRVIISDGDFERNLREHSCHAEIVRHAALHSAHLVMLLHWPDPEHVKRYEAMGARVISVQEMDDFPRMATDLALALFPEAPTDVL